MTVTGTTEEQFERLHNQFVPMLYHTALYLLGDIAAAEDAAARAWTQTFREVSRRADERAFALCAERLLVEACENAYREQGLYTVPTQGGLSQAFLQTLSGLRFPDRCLIVLAVAQNRGADEIAAVLQQPVWLVNRRLQRVSEKLCQHKLEVCC